MKKILIIYANILVLVISSNSFSKENDKASNFEDKTNKVKLGFNVLLNSYFRKTMVIEQTGNEATFGVYADLSFTYKNKFLDVLTFKGFCEARLRQELNEKGRFYENFDTKVLKIKELYIGAELYSHHYIHLGKMKNVFGRNYFNYFIPNVVEDIGNGFYYKALSNKDRDISLLYELVLDFYDTGLFYKYKNDEIFFEFDFGLTNGENGLDSNSAKTVLFRLGFNTNNVNLGISFHIGEKGSVPIKTHSKLINLDFNFKLGDSISLSGEFLYNIHGFRSADIDPTNQTQMEYLKNLFGYGDYFFSPDDLPNIFYPGEPLQGYGFYINFNWKMFNFLTLEINFSFYDPDMRWEYVTIYRIKTKYIGKLILNIDDFFKFYLGGAWTEDPVYYAYPQIYEVEPLELHPHRSNYDAFIGAILCF